MGDDTANATFAIALFSGTADRLQAAATMAAGAVAMGMETHVFLMFWGVDAFKKDVIDTTRPVSAEYGDRGKEVAAAMEAKGVPPWHEVLRMAADIGDLHVHACAMTMDLLDIPKEHLDPMVEDVIGVATFVELSRDGNILFI